MTTLIESPHVLRLRLFPALKPCPLTGSYKLESHSRRLLEKSIFEITREWNMVDHRTLIGPGEGENLFRFILQQPLPHHRHRPPFARSFRLDCGHCSSSFTVSCYCSMNRRKKQTRGDSYNQWTDAMDLTNPSLLPPCSGEWSKYE